MSVFRIHKTENYTVMSNYHLLDRGLTPAAKGLLSLVFALPDDWKYSISGLASLNAVGEKAIRNTLNELKEHGYLEVTKVYPSQGHQGISYAYDFYEVPKFYGSGESAPSKPQVGQAYPPVGLVEDPLQRITSSRDLPFTDDSLVEPTREDLLVRGGFVPPTLDEVRAYCSGNMLDKCDPELFFATYEAQGWMLGNGMPMVDWQAAARKWHAKDRNRDAAHRGMGGRPKTDFSGYKLAEWEET